MKLKVGIFGVSVIFICAIYGIMTHLDPHVIVMMVWIVAALSLTGLYFVARSMHREGRILRDYDLELQQICPKCGYDIRTKPQRCPECGMEFKSSEAVIAEANARKN